MAPDLGELPRHAACPACGAALRPGSPWCTLCYADLRPLEERPVQPVQPAPPPVAPMGDPLTQPLIDFLPSSVPPAPVDGTAPQPTTAASTAEPTWPCTSCGAPNPLAATRCGTCGAAFLSTVAAASRSALVLPVVGDLTRMSRSQRIMGALAVVFVLVLFVAMVTLLLAKRPPEPSTTVIVPTTEPSAAVIQPTAAPEVTGPTSTPTTAPTTTQTTGPATAPSVTVTVTP